eukprot:NODE_389_length_9467_cov_0.241567.p4 type:complete len:439 gc:universal NODE_389_length_9467_cov_0.241567:4375-5691(+)
MHNLEERIELKDGRRGVVRYIGIINDKEWIGIEFDSKNDGKHDGKNYFQVHPSQSASLLKSPIITKSNLSLDDAVLQKYFKRVDNIKSSIGNVELESVGWEKIYNQIKNNLSVISLQNMCIANLNTTVKPYSMVSELCLSGNLFTDLSEFPQSAFPKLQILDISCNRFKNLKLPPLLIQELVLSNTLLSLSQVLDIISNQANLSKLYISANCQSSTEIIPFRSYANIKDLDISYNQYEQLQLIFDVFPNIKRLNASHNKIKNISHHVCMDYLNLSNNLIDSFDYLDYLVVQDLRLLRNPINGDSCRHFTIACLDLILFNGSAISADDKRDSEVYFIQNFQNRLNRKHIQLSQKYSYDFHEPAKANLIKYLISVTFELNDISKVKLLVPTLNAKLVSRVAQKLFNLPYIPQMYVDGILITEVLSDYINENMELKIILKQ